MSTPAFTFTDRARPIIQIGLGSAYDEFTTARWDSAHWDTPPDAAWGGTEPEWLDVTCDTFTLRCEYGRQRTTDRFVVGQASVVVYNATGWADPNAVDQPGVLTMRPGRAIRLGVEHVVHGVRWLFRGFIDALTPVYDPTEPDTVELSCIDALGEVNRTKTLPLADPAFGGDSVDVRIGRLLDLAVWPVGKRQLSPTGDTLIASDMGGQLADLLGQAADSGGGNVYGDLDANVTYRARDWQTFVPGTPPDGTIGNVEQGHTIPGTPQVDGYFDTTKGNVTTPDTASMTIDGAFRLTWRLRLDAIGAGFPALLTKGTSPREVLLYLYDATKVHAISTTNTAGANVDLVVAQPVATGDHTYGIESAPGSTAATAIVDGVRSARVWGSVPTFPDTNAALQMGGSPTLLSRLYWAQLEAINRATFTFPGVAGNYMSVPAAAGDPRSDFEIAARVAPTSWTPTTAGNIVAQYTSGASAWQLRHMSTGHLRLELVLTAGGNSAAQSTVVVPLTSAGGWVKVTRRASDGRVQFFTAADAAVEPTTWTQLGADVIAGVGALAAAATAPYQIGANWTGGNSNMFTGRIRRVIVRNGIGSASPVLDVSDANWMPLSPTTFRAVTGQTVTVAQTAGNILVAGLSNAVVWRFDANDYPGTGTSYVDPRGRTWTLSAAGAITPKVPAVPDVVVPADVCPIQWERPFARADLATRVIIGRDVETAQVLDDIDGQTLYGIEPFERTDLLTEYDDRITMLGERILRVRSAYAAPRIRSVTLDAATADAALDLMTTVDVYKPSRYRCRLQYPTPRGLVFDLEHIATGAAHEMSPKRWQLALNLDLADPYAAVGGRWDGTYWDQALWAAPAGAGT